MNTYDLKLWYENTYAKAENPNKAEIDNRALLVKAMEELIELCLVSNIGPEFLEQAFATALQKETKKGTDKQPRRRSTQVEELADLHICIGVWMGLENINPRDIEDIISRKMAVNTYQRRWRVNEFGGLSHIKGGEGQ